MAVVDAPKQSSTVDPWGAPTTSGNNTWTSFNNDDKSSSPFGASSEWPQPMASSFSEAIQYRVLYDYVPERADEIAIASGDIITVSKVNASLVGFSGESNDLRLSCQNRSKGPFSLSSMIFVRLIQRNSKTTIGSSVPSAMISRDSFQPLTPNELRTYLDHTFLSNDSFRSPDQRLLLSFRFSSVVHG